jgi:dephospho-CoA kinase
VDETGVGRGVGYSVNLPLYPYTEDDTYLWAFREVVPPLLEAFGPDILAGDGSIDRQKLGAIVFSDPQARQRLNAITHPRIKELMRERLAELAEKGTEIAVLEAALLLEAGWDDLVDEIWVTVASPEVAVQRLAQDKGLSREEALARIGAQLSDEERIQRAAVVIDTGCLLAETRRMVEEAWSRLLTRRSSPSGQQGGLKV